MQLSWDIHTACKRLTFEDTVLKRWGKAQCIENKLNNGSLGFSKMVPRVLCFTNTSLSEYQFKGLYLNVYDMC